MSWFIPGIVIGLLSTSWPGLAQVAALCGIAVHGIPKTVKYSRDEAILSKVTEEQRRAMMLAGVRDPRVPAPSTLIAIAFVHSVNGAVGTMIVAALIYGIRLLTD